MTATLRSSRGGRRLRRALLIVVLVGIAALVAWGFVKRGGEASDDADHPVAAPSRVAEVDGQAAVKLDAQTRKGSGIEVAALSPAPYQAQIHAYGMVLDLAQLTDLSDRSASAEAQVKIAQAKLAASKAALDRARGLYRNQQNVSLAQFQAADAAFQADQAALTAAQAQARAFAGTATQAFGTVVGKAIVDNSPLIARLVARQVLLLQVTLPPGATLPTAPQAATVQVAGGTPVPVQFLSPAARTDPQIQGMSFLYLAPAANSLLPGMNVLVSLPSGPPTQGATVPPSAIVWWQDRAWLYRQSGETLFVRTQVPTSLPAADGGYVVEGLPPGTRIVTQGAQLLLSEEFRAQLHADTN